MMDYIKLITVFLICFTALVAVTHLDRSSGEIESWGFILTCIGSFWLMCTGIYWTMIWYPASNELHNSIYLNSSIPEMIMNIGISLICISRLLPERIRCFAFFKKCPELVAGTATRK